MMNQFDACGLFIVKHAIVLATEYKYIHSGLFEITQIADG